MKKLSVLIVVLFCAALCLGQASFQPPIVTAGVTTAISWTSGTVNNGGHPVAVAAGSSTVTLNKADCSSPVFANCNFVIANSSGTVSVTTTLATAIASGNSLLALIETGAVTTTQIVYPWQSGTLWLQAAGPSTTLTTPTLTTPTIAAGLLASGSASNDFSGSTGTFKTSTGAVTLGPGAVGISGQATFSAGILASGAVANDFSGGSGTFKTSTGAVTVGPGAVGISGQATFSAGILASGAIANDFSGGTGTFKTSTGAGTFGGSSNTFNGTAPQITLGTASSLVGSIAVNNATSGTITVQPPTGALGTTTVSWPDVAGGIPTVQECSTTGSGNQTCSPAATTRFAQVISGQSTLSANSAVITFSPGFTSSTSYFCVANDVTTRANVVQMVSTSATTATITNTTGATDNINFICVGN